MRRTSYSSILKCLEPSFVCCVYELNFVLYVELSRFATLIYIFSSPRLFFLIGGKKNVKLDENKKKRKENPWKTKFMTKGRTSDGRWQNKRKSKMKLYVVPFLESFFAFSHKSKMIAKDFKDGRGKFCFSFLSFFLPSKSPWQFMFVLGSIDVKGICHLNNKSYAAQNRATGKKKR